ncbi:MAG: M6 family metalloprotease domain-containing protein [Pseudonocardia sp.]|nr:M6 family metalloprotease domain-containing protein [Pseudonocardia sp.]
MPHDDVEQARHDHPGQALPGWTADQLAGTCAIAPSPELREQWRRQLADARASLADGGAPGLRIEGEPRRLGFNDGVIIPPDAFPVGTPLAQIRNAAADRAPLRGTVRVAVILVDFADRRMTQTAAHFQDLFFSAGVLPHGSVKEYYTDVTGGLVTLDGVVVGPYRMPQTLAWYAANGSGIGKNGTPFRSPQMAHDAAVAADPAIDFSQYDNDGNGYVDAFIVVHAGSGAEVTGSPGDIWSHKSTLSSPYSADGKQIYGYLTIPEDCRIGVCAHELGHLLFGFPDLYDTDYSSEGIGNWCLMAGGSWNGGGDIPAHPSAWCKANQGWATVTSVTGNGPVAVIAIETSRTMYRLWTGGAGGAEYFLLENRQPIGYDSALPGSGLLLWHIDENQPGNTDENHYKVALLQADGKRDLELDHNRGDSGDPYPGSSNNTSASATTTPNTKSYAGADTSVSVTSISASGPGMTAQLTVTAKSVFKDVKDARKERKEIVKEHKEFKELKEFKEFAKDRKEFLEGPAPTATPGGSATALDTEARLSMLEAAVFGVAAGDPGAAGGAGAPAGSPFIQADLRPELQGATGDETSSVELEHRMAAGDAHAKREFDTAAR